MRVYNVRCTSYDMRYYLKVARTYTTMACMIPRCSVTCRHVCSPCSFSIQAPLSRAGHVLEQRCSTESQVRELVDAIRGLKWKDAILFYDDHFDPEFLPRISSELNTANVQTVLLRYPGGSSQTSREEMRAGNNERGFARDRARRDERNNETQVDIDDYDEMVNDHGEFLSLHNNYVTLLNHSNTMRILYKVRINTLQLLGPHYYWIIVSDHNSSYNPTSGLLDSPLLPLLVVGDNMALLGSRVVIKDKQEDLVGTDGTRSEIVNGSNCNQSNWFSLTSRRSIMQFLSVSPPRGSDVDTDDIIDLLFPNRKYGFNGRQFLVTSLSHVPFTYKDGDGKWAGICYAMLDILSASLNFTYRTIEPLDRNWGAVDEKTGKFNGMIGMLQNKEVDFGVGNFGMTNERKKSVDFSISWFVDHHVIIMRHDQNKKHAQTFLCLGPFRLAVWVAILISIFAIGICMFVTERFDKWSDRRNNEFIGTSYERIAYSLCISFGVVVQQSIYFLPSAHSTRLIVGGLWLAVIVVVGSYNSHLVAFLTAPAQNKPPINSLADLKLSRSMKFGFMAHTDMQELFSSALDRTYALLWNRIKDRPSFYLEQDAISGLQRAAKDSSYVFLTDESLFNSLSAKQQLDDSFTSRNHSSKNRYPYHCHLTSARENFMFILNAFPFQKNSPYLRMFNKRILNMIQSGMINRWLDIWYSGSGKKICGDINMPKAKIHGHTKFTIYEAEGCIYLLTMGIIASTLSFFLEMYTRVKGISYYTSIIYLKLTRYTTRKKTANLS